MKSIDDDDNNWIITNTLSYLSHTIITVTEIKLRYKIENDYIKVFCKLILLLLLWFVLPSQLFPVLIAVGSKSESPILNVCTELFADHSDLGDLHFDLFLPLILLLISLFANTSTFFFPLLFLLIPLLFLLFFFISVVLSFPIFSPSAPPPFSFVTLLL